MGVYGELLFMPVMRGLTGCARRKVWEQAGIIISRVMDSAVGAMMAVWEAAQALGEHASALAITAWNFAEKEFSKAANGAAGAMKLMYAGAAQAVVAIKETASNLMDKLGDGFEDAINGIKDLGGKITDAVKGIFGGAEMANPGDPYIRHRGVHALRAAGRHAEALSLSRKLTEVAHQYLTYKGRHSEASWCTKKLATIDDYYSKHTPRNDAPMTLDAQWQEWEE